MKFLIRRLLISLFTLFSVITIVFFIIHLIPGDPVQLMLGEGAQQADILKLREELGLNKPLIVQYSEYLRNIYAGSFGKSLIKGESVFSIIEARLPSTIFLAFGGMLVAIFIAFPLGIYSSKKSGSLIEKITTGISVFGIAIPNFVLGPLLIMLFSIYLGLLPVAGDNSFAHFILPSITLGTGLAAILVRIIKASLEEEKEKEYIKNLMIIGLNEKLVWRNHIVKNALIPVITVMALQFGALLTGTIITETVFSIHGIGTLLIEAIKARDYPVIQGLIIFISSVYIITNLLADFIYMLLDPRIRKGEVR